MHGRAVALAAPFVVTSLMFTTDTVLADRPGPDTVLGEPSPPVSRILNRATYSNTYGRNRAEDAFNRRDGGYGRGGDAYSRRGRDFIQDVDQLPALEGNISTVRANALQPDPRVALRSRKLKPVPQADAFAKAIYNELTLPAKQALRVRKDQRAAIIAFYQNRGFKPAWTGDFGLGERGKHVLTVLSKAEEEGLRAMDYLPASLNDFSDFSIVEENATASNLARIDLELTAAALDYVWDMTAGAVNPFRISKIHTLKVQEVLPADALKRLTETLHPERYLETLQPKIPEYAQLKAALARYRQQAGTAEVIQIPAGVTIKAGMSDERLDAIARRLIQLGFYKTPEIEQVQAALPVENSDTGTPASQVAAIQDAEVQGAVVLNAVVQDADLPLTEEPISEASDASTTVKARPIPAVYDSSLVDAVKAFQEQSGLGVDGAIGPKTLRTLNQQSVSGQMEKIQLAMERLRWLPRGLENRHVFVNQAFYKTWMVEDGNVIFRSDVIIGKPKYQTAVFSDEMETVIFNPYWWVPRSIAGAEMLPRLRLDPTYLDRKGFEVLTADSGVRSSASIDWYQYDAKTMPFNIRQLPGPKNALGRVKFLFPNKHAIYMHDTPARNLFSKKMRAFSHGCVRVGKPLEFARVIMSSEGWSGRQIDDAINSKVRQEVKLKRKIPVYLGYFTAWPDENGTVQFRDDVYGRDRVLAQALEQNTAANDRLALR